MSFSSAGTEFRLPFLVLMLLCPTVHQRQRTASPGWIRNTGRTLATPSVTLSLKPSDLLRLHHDTHPLPLSNGEDGHHFTALAQLTTQEFHHGQQLRSGSTGAQHHFLRAPRNLPFSRLPLACHFMTYHEARSLISVN